VGRCSDRLEIACAAWLQAQLKGCLSTQNQEKRQQDRCELAEARLLSTADFDCFRSGSLRTVFGGFFFLVFGDLAIGAASLGRAEQHEPNALPAHPGVRQY
jgi:hypothetical protein